MDLLARDPDLTRLGDPAAELLAAVCRHAVDHARRAALGLPRLLCPHPLDPALLDELVDDLVGDPLRKAEEAEAGAETLLHVVAVAGALDQQPQHDVLVGYRAHVPNPVNGTVHHRHTTAPPIGGIPSPRTYASR